MPDRPEFFLRCLTYPLAQVFEAFDLATGELSGPFGFVRVRLTQFAHIVRVGDSKVTAAERRIAPASANWAEWR